MRKKKAAPNFATLKHIDPKDKAQCDFWMRTWGVSATQLRAAFRNTRSTEVKVIERYLRERGNMKCLTNLSFQVLAALWRA